MNYSVKIFLLVLSINYVCAGEQERAAEDQGVKYADKCEACKVLAIELQGRLTETGKSHDVLEMGFEQF
jgi:protein canopy 3/4